MERRESMSHTCLICSRVHRRQGYACLYSDEASLDLLLLLPSGVRTGRDVVVSGYPDTCYLPCVLLTEHWCFFTRLVHKRRPTSSITCGI